MTQNNSDLIFAFPYHDPKGIYNDLFIRSISLIKKTFKTICVSVTEPTILNNAKMLAILEKEGFHIFKNTKDSNIGDHYRNALKTAANLSRDNKIYFGFIDRTLFALNTNFCSEFLKNINENFSEMVLLERSKKAWETHPKNYREIEQITNRLASYVIGKEVELGTCGFLIRSNVAKKILEESFAESYSAAAEWILLAYLFKISPIIKKTDWLSWEDPFIENVDAKELKIQRENQKGENQKRLGMNIPFINLLAQERFSNI